MSQGNITNEVYPITFQKLEELGIETVLFEEYLEDGIGTETNAGVFSDERDADELELQDCTVSVAEIMAEWNRINTEFKNIFPSLYLSAVFYDVDNGECYDSLEGGFHIVVENAMIMNPEAEKLGVCAESYSTFG